MGRTWRWTFWTGQPWWCLRGGATAPKPVDRNAHGLLQGAVPHACVWPAGAAAYSAVAGQAVLKYWRGAQAGQGGGGTGGRRCGRARGGALPPERHHAGGGAAACCVGMHGQPAARSLEYDSCRPAPGFTSGLAPVLPWQLRLAEAGCWSAARALPMRVPCS